MKTFSLALCFITLQSVIGQVNTSYEPSASNPYGQANPLFKQVLNQFKPMIGSCDCRSVSRNPDQTWRDTTNLKWEFRYVLNGTAIMDFTWNEDGRSGGSIRQYNADSTKWYATFFSSTAVRSNPPTWSGGFENNEFVLYKRQKAPNGTDGFGRITFSDISVKGFNWRMDWVNEAETFELPVGYIFCVKRTN